MNSRWAIINMIIIKIVFIFIIRLCLDQLYRRSVGVILLVQGLTQGHFGCQWDDWIGHLGKITVLENQHTSI